MFYTKVSLRIVDVNGRLKNMQEQIFSGMIGMCRSNWNQLPGTTRNVQQMRLEFVHMQKQIQIFFSMVAAPCFGSIGAPGPNSWQKNKWFLISQDRCPPPFHGSANNILQIISINSAIGFRHKLRKINGAYNEDGRRHLSYIQDIFYKSHDVYIESRVMCQDNFLTCIIFPILLYRGTLHMYFTFIYLTILLKARSNHNE